MAGIGSGWLLKWLLLPDAAHGMGRRWSYKKEGWEGAAWTCARAVLRTRHGMRIIGEIYGEQVKEAVFRRYLHLCDDEEAYSLIQAQVLYTKIGTQCTTCRKMKPPASPQTKWYLCKRCRLAYYCGRSCQKRDWNTGGHRDRCRRNTNWSLWNVLLLALLPPRCGIH